MVGCEDGAITIAFDYETSSKFDISGTDGLDGMNLDHDDSDRRVPCELRARLNLLRLGFVFDIC